MPSQLFGTNSLGGFFTNNELSLQLRIKAQPLKRFRQFVPFKFEDAVDVAVPFVPMFTLFDKLQTYFRSADWNCAPATESSVIAISFISVWTTELSTSSSDKATSWLVKAMAFAYSRIVSVP